MKSSEVTADELLDLADELSKIGGRARERGNQQKVVEAMNACVAIVVDAAKTIALKEVMARRSLQKVLPIDPASAGDEYESGLDVVVTNEADLESSSGRDHKHLVPPPHPGCGHPARCPCECRGCKRAWEEAGRPSPLSGGK